MALGGVLMGNIKSQLAAIVTGMANTSGDGVAFKNDERCVDGAACKSEERSAEPPEVTCSLNSSEMADGDKRFGTGTGGARCNGLIN